jgi:hypothetical protein
MPADPFSCTGGHVGTAAPGAVLPVRGFGARGGFAARYRVAALFAAYGAVCRRGGLPTGRPPVLGRGLSGRLGAVARSAQARYGGRVSEGGASGRRMRLLRLYLSRMAARCGSGSVRAAVLLRACLSFRGGCPPLAPLGTVPRSCGPKRSAPETLMCGLRGADREARSVIFPPASGSGRASRRIRGSTPASSAA